MWTLTNFSSGTVNSRHHTIPLLLGQCLEREVGRWGEGIRPAEYGWCQQLTKLWLSLTRSNQVQSFCVALRPQRPKDGEPRVAASIFRHSSCTELCRIPTQRCRLIYTRSLSRIRSTQDSTALNFSQHKMSGFPCEVTWTKRIVQSDNEGVCGVAQTHKPARTVRALTVRLGPVSRSVTVRDWCTDNSSHSLTQ